MGGIFFENKITVKQINEKLTDFLFEDQDRTLEDSQVSKILTVQDVQMAVDQILG